MKLKARVKYASMVWNDGHRMFRDSGHLSQGRSSSLDFRGSLDDPLALTGSKPRSWMLQE